MIHSKNRSNSEDMAMAKNFIKTDLTDHYLTFATLKPSVTGKIKKHAE